MSNYQNLSVPFNIPIPGGMHSGKMVTVQGTIPPTSQRFAVNLLCRSGDIALHVCPKFKENCVVRNNVLNMNWGPEEKHGTMPIQPGQQFEMLILCEVYDFKIAFNGYHFTQFSHRVPFSSITNLAVDGEVLVFNVDFKEQNKPGSNLSNNTGYGFQPVSPAPNYQPGGLYPTINPPSPNKNTGSYPTSGSLYPTQPSYGNIPHHGSYPQTPSSNYGGHSPNSNYGGHSPTPHTKPGILEQAGMAVAGILGPGLLAGGMNRKCDSQSPSCGKTNLLDDAGRALAGVLGGSGSGLTGSGTTQRGIQPYNPASGFLGQAGSALAGVLGGAGLAGSGTTHRGVQPHTPASGFLGQAGSALAGVLGGSGLAGSDTTQRGIHSRTPYTNPGFLGQAGSALAGVLGGAGLAGSGTTQRGGRPRSPASGFLDQAGSALAGVLGGSGLGGSGTTQRGIHTSTPRTNPGFLDQAGSALAEALGGRGVSGRGHHNKNRLGGLGGVLGTAAAGAALTGHLNPIKAAKKHRKAQKKALKYGLPIAGAGLGAYALHKGLKGFRRSSSSSSCSSSD